MEIVVRGASALGATRAVMDSAPSALLTLARQLGLNVGGDARDGLGDAHRDGPGQGVHLLYLVPRHCELSARGQASVLRAGVLRDGARIHVCVLASDHHALTLALAGATLADLARNGAWSNPGHGVQLANQVLSASRSLVWHPSLAGVEVPRAKPGQRWASALGRGSYLAELGHKRFDRMRSRLAVDPSDTLYVGGQPPGRLVGLLSGVGVNQVDLQTESRAPYRGRKSVELTMMPPLWPSPPTGALCGTCGAYQVDDWCAFCNQHPARQALAGRNRSQDRNQDWNQVAAAYA